MFFPTIQDLLLLLLPNQSYIPKDKSRHYDKRHPLGLRFACTTDEFLIGIILYFIQVSLRCFKTLKLTCLLDTSLASIRKLGNPENVY